MSPIFAVALALFALVMLIGSLIMMATTRYKYIWLACAALQSVCLALQYPNLHAVGIL